MTRSNIIGFQVSGLSRSLDNPLEFSVVDGQIKGPASYRVTEPVDVQNGAVKASKILVISTAEIITRLKSYMTESP